MTGQIPLPPPSVATLAARADTAARNARYGDGPLPGPGQTWRRRSDGLQMLILGRSSAAWIVQPLVDGIDTSDDSPTSLRVGLDDHADGYDYVACDHQSFCCSSHRVHTQPHRGCILR